MTEQVASFPENEPPPRPELRRIAPDGRLGNGPSWIRRRGGPGKGCRMSAGTIEWT